MYIQMITEMRNDIVNVKFGNDVGSIICQYSDKLIEPIEAIDPTDYYLHEDIIKKTYHDRYDNIRLNGPFIDDLKRIEREAFKKSIDYDKYIIFNETIKEYKNKICKLREYEDELKSIKFGNTISMITLRCCNSVFYADSCRTRIHKYKALIEHQKKEIKKTKYMLQFNLWAI